MAGRFTARRVAAPDIPAVEEPSSSTLEGVAWTVFPESAPEPPPPPVTQAANPLMSDKLLDAKVRLHRRLIEEINLSALEKLPEDEIRKHVQQLVSQYVLVERLALNAQELAEFVSEILDEMTGLGPLEPLLKDPSISDILINGHECVYVERGGMLEPLAVRFKDEQHLLRIINKIVSAVGRRVDESHPLCDARLQDGSRVNVAVRPIGVDGPLVSIRKFSKKPRNLAKLVELLLGKLADRDQRAVDADRPHRHVDARAVLQARVAEWVTFIDTAADRGDDLVDDAQQMLLVLEAHRQRLKHAAALDIDAFVAVDENVADRRVLQERLERT
jgi:pilus assembly protein CpaF